MLNLSKYILLLQVVYIVTSLPVETPDPQTTGSVPVKVDVPNTSRNISVLKHSNTEQPPKNNVQADQAVAKGLKLPKNAVKSDELDAKKSVIESKNSSANFSGLKAIFDHLGNHGSWKKNTSTKSEEIMKTSHISNASTERSSARNASHKSTLSTKSDLNTTNKPHVPTKKEHRSNSSKTPKEAAENTSKSSNEDHVRARRNDGYLKPITPQQMVEAKVELEKKRSDEHLHVLNEKKKEPRNEGQHNRRVIIRADREENYHSTKQVTRKAISGTDADRKYRSKERDNGREIMRTHKANDYRPGEQQHQKVTVKAGSERSFKQEHQHGMHSKHHHKVSPAKTGTLRDGYPLESRHMNAKTGDGNTDYPIHRNGAHAKAEKQNDYDPQVSRVKVDELRNERYAQVVAAQERPTGGRLKEKSIMNKRDNGEIRRRDAIVGQPHLHEKQGQAKKTGCC